MVIIACSSRCLEVYGIPDQETDTVVNDVIEEWFSRCEVPQEFHSDRGRSFKSGVFQQVCRKLDIGDTRMTPLQF